MDRNQIFLLSAGLAIVAFRIYQKYIKKNQGKTGSESKTGSTFKSPSKDDDYEPYSKKG